MEQKIESPPTIDSLNPIQVFKTNIFYLNKKRKLQSEDWDFPSSKHKCWGQTFPSQCVSMFDQNPNAETGKADGMGLDNNISEPQSASGSNSFAEDSDSVVSVYNEASKYKPDYAKSCQNDWPSKSSVDNEAANFFSMGNFTAMNTSSTGKDDLAFPSRENDHLHQHDDGQDANHSPEDRLLEHGNHSYGCTEYGNDDMEQCMDTEFEEFYPDGTDPNMYVLSSGRWSINKEGQSGATKPTIDQEFEQYFSMLML